MSNITSSLASSPSDDETRSSDIVSMCSNSNEKRSTCSSVYSSVCNFDGSNYSSDDDNVSMLSVDNNFILSETGNSVNDITIEKEKSLKRKGTCTDNEPSSKKIIKSGKVNMRAFNEKKKIAKRRQINVGSKSVSRNASVSLIKDNPTIPLTEENVKMALQKGEIVTCEPLRKSKNSHIYEVCKRLKYATGERIKEFLMCTNCGSILNINLSTHYNVLTRHYESCTGKIARSGKGGSIQFVRSEFLSFVEQLLKMGSKQGKSISLNHIKIPKVMDGQNMKKFLGILRNRRN